MPHNGGKFQLGPNFVNFGGDLPFMNRAKHLQAWGRTGGGAANQLPILDRDSNGYPTRTDSAAGGGAPSGNLFSFGWIEGHDVYDDNWVLKATGEGTLGLFGIDATVSGSLSGTNPRAVITIGSGASGIGNNMGISVAGVTFGNHLRNIVLVREDEEDEYDAQKLAYPDREPFNPAFLSYLQTMKPGVIRFLDWGLYNTAMQALWAHRPPTTHFAFGGGSHYYMPSLCGTSAMTNSGDAYTQALTGFTLGHGAAAIVQFNASSSGTTPTININGTGAYQITRDDHPGDELNSAQKPVANNHAVLVFDADLEKYIKFGGDSQNGSKAMQGMVPPEICIDLCNQVGAHPWFPMPYLTYDASTHAGTDWCSSLAALCQSRGESWMVPRIECAPNECWNSLFCGTWYGWRKATDHWGVGDFRHNSWVGKVSSIAAQTLSTSYGADRSKYQAIVGVQTILGATLVNIPSHMGDRFGSDTYVDEDGGEPANDWITHVAIANYWGNEKSNNELISSGYAMDYWGEDEDGRQDIIDWYVGTDRPPAQMAASGTTIQTLLTNWYTYVRDTLSPALKLTHYEGGPSYDMLANDFTGNVACPYGTISAASKAASCVLQLETGHAAVIGGYLAITNVSGMTELNGNVYEITNVSGRNVTIAVNSTGFTTYTSGGYARYVERVAISGASKASSCVLTLPSGVGAYVGQPVVIGSVGGMTELNGNTYSVTVVNGASVTINVNSTGFTTYTSGGYAYIGYGRMINRVRARAYRASNSFWVTQGYNKAVAALPYAEMPSQFLLVGGYVIVTDDTINSDIQPWGVLKENIYNTSDVSPAVEALQLFSEGKEKIALRASA